MSKVARKQVPPQGSLSRFREFKKIKIGNKTTNNYQLKLTCWGFPTLPFEMYSLSKSENSDGFMDQFRKKIDQTADFPYLSDAGFNGYLPRRQSLESDIPWFEDGKPYWRTMMLRIVPEGMTTAETRAEGLQILQNFFRSKTLTDKPIHQEIDLEDATNENDLLSVDYFVENKNIVDLMRVLIEPESLNRTFYKSMPFEAKLFFAGTPPIECIRSFGYPGNQTTRDLSLSIEGHVAMAPGVNLRSQLSVSLDTSYILIDQVFLTLLFYFRNDAKSSKVPKNEETIQDYLLETISILTITTLRTKLAKKI